MEDENLKAKRGCMGKLWANTALCRGSCVMHRLGWLQDQESERQILLQSREGRWEITHSTDLQTWAVCQSFQGCTHGESSGQVYYWGQVSASMKKPRTWCWPRDVGSSLHLPAYLCKLNWSVKPAALASVCWCSVAQLCPALCDPMDRSAPGLPVPHHLLVYPGGFCGAGTRSQILWSFDSQPPICPWRLTVARSSVFLRLESTFGQQWRGRYPVVFPLSAPGLTGTSFSRSSLLQPQVGPGSPTPTR